jgi:hypothetical protein
MIALEMLLVFVALMFVLWVYRGLIHSRWFARLVGDIVEVPPETDQEVIRRRNQAEDAAFQAAQAAEEVAVEKKKAAAALRKRPRRSPDDPLPR